MKLYIVKYCENEIYPFSKYDSPYPIFYTLNENKAKEFFENRKYTEIEHFIQLLESFPKYKNDESYKICKDSDNVLEISVGNWYYEWEICTVELDKELT